MRVLTLTELRLERWIAPPGYLLSRTRAIAALSSPP